MPSSVDHEWFLSVLDSHQRLIHKVCWAYAGSVEEREDLFQEIAIRLLSAARDYDPNRKLSTWIYRVALNVAIDAHRKRRYRRKEELGFEGDLEPAPDPDPLITEQQGSSSVDQSGQSGIHATSRRLSHTAESRQSSGNSSVEWARYLEFLIFKRDTGACPNPWPVDRSHRDIRHRAEAIFGGLRDPIRHMIIVDFIA